MGGVGLGVRGKPQIAAGPDSLASGGSGESGPASLWPEGPGSRGEERRARTCLGGGVRKGGEEVASVPLVDSEEHGLGCRTPPGPTPAGQGQCAGFSALTQGTEGTPNTATPTAGPQRRSPLRESSRLGHWIPGAWEQVLLPGCWASLAVGIDLGPARLLPPRTSCFPDQGGRRPGFVCIESAGSVCPGPAGTEGQGGEQGGGRVGGGGERLKM